MEENPGLISFLGEKLDAAAIGGKLGKGFLEGLIDPDNPNAEILGELGRQEGEKIGKK